MEFRKTEKTNTIRIGLENLLVCRRLGDALRNLRRTDEAIACYKASLKLDPNRIAAYNRLGNCLRDCGRYEEAVACFRASLRITPDCAKTLCNLGNAIKDQGRFEEAASCYRNAVSLFPSLPEAHFNLSLILLLSGQFRDGWKEYEWRMKTDHRKEAYTRNRTFGLDAGTTIDGKTIFVHDEQGFGDTIQFVRYLPLLKEKGAQVVFETREPLVPLLSGFSGIDRLLSRSEAGNAHEACDFTVPLLSLPGIFGTGPETIPASVPYLRSPPCREELWGKRIPRDGFRVGLAWFGSDIHGENARRSCPDETLALLNEIQDVKWFGLQREPCVLPPIKAGFENLGKGFRDFADTAGAIHHLDLVITVDTAVAHLAGAMGKPVWVLLPRVPDWRWMLDRTDSPWYPTMRLFRQEKAGDWGSVIGRVRDELRKTMEPSVSEIVSLPAAASAETRFHLGNDLLLRGYPAQAVMAYLEAVHMAPGRPEIFFNMGRAYQQIGDLSMAVSCYREAIRLNPEFSQAYNNLGTVYYGQEDFQKAARCFQRAASRSDNAQAWFNLGNARWKTGDPKGAFEAYLDSVRIRPDYADAVRGAGEVLDFLGRFDEAMEWYQRALRLNPKFVEPLFSRSLSLLRDACFSAGWKGYEWRFLRENARFAYPYRLDSPRWDGSSFAGMRLFVHCEQGLGDTIQFSRYLPQVKARGGTVIFEVQEPLAELFRGFPGIDELAVLSPNGKTELAFDRVVPLLSLPGLFETKLDSIPAQIPYLGADPSKSRRWSGRLDPLRLRVGLVWAGGPFHRRNEKRSCPLKHFAPLFRIPGVTFYGIQTGEEARQAKDPSTGFSLVNLGEELSDFSDTAALMDHLDLLISVDTAAAHLAGAMGKPVWVLLPHEADWRWLKDRKDTPWYPTMRLFRQETPGDWNGVMDRIAESLRAGSSAKRSRC